MDQKRLETISAAYTVYSLINPEDRITISIDTFAKIYETNLICLREIQNDLEKNAEKDNRGIALQKAENSLEKGIQKAEETIADKEKLSAMLTKLKDKMKTIPMVGNVLSNVPVMFKLVNSYLKDEYTDIPRNKLVIIVSALAYLLAPIDLIPDFIPIAGLIDDMAVISVCINRTKDEIEKYLAWREINKPQMENK